MELFARLMTIIKVIVFLALSSAAYLWFPIHKGSLLTTNDSAEVDASRPSLSHEHLAYVSATRE